MDGLDNDADDEDGRDEREDKSHDGSGLRRELSRVVEDLGA